MKIYLQYLQLNSILRQTIKISRVKNFQPVTVKKHTVEVAYQRTGFIFNENGAVVESEAVIVTDSASAVPIITHPKKMILTGHFNHPETGRQSKPLLCYESGKHRTIDEEITAANIGIANSGA
ncbi:MAG: hypothetical protein IPM95_10655 [Sphingobacteriales bacterium]|nr:hypothetical protein [Sphingobacteriales bacterium]